MIRKKHNHTLQTNIRHHEEEPHNTDTRKTGQVKQPALSLPLSLFFLSLSLFPIKMIVKLDENIKLHVLLTKLVPKWDPSTWSRRTELDCEMDSNIFSNPGVIAKLRDALRIYLKYKLYLAFSLT